MGWWGDVFRKFMTAQVGGNEGGVFIAHSFFNLVHMNNAAYLKKNALCNDSHIPIRILWLIPRVNLSLYRDVTQLCVVFPLSFYYFHYPLQKGHCIGRKIVVGGAHITQGPLPIDKGGT